MTLDSLFQADAEEWIKALPAYQRDTLLELLKRGTPAEAIADNWISATAENTYGFGTERRAGDKSAFRSNVMLELEAFLCGDPKYDKERAGLFGEKSATRTYVISAVAVAIAPSLGVTAAFLAPIVALMLASLGKISVNAWCATRKQAREKGASAAPA